MYCNTMITKKSHFVYTFIALLPAKCCYGRQVNKRQAVANAVVLLSTVENVVLHKMRKVFVGRIKVVGGRVRSSGRSLATPVL